VIKAEKIGRWIGVKDDELVAVSDSSASVVVAKFKYLFILT
jgi:hypothetical protein